MNDIAELWSLPWHELQHSLAAGFGGNAGQAGGSGSPFVRVVGGPCVISPVAGSRMPSWTRTRGSATTA